MKYVCLGYLEPRKFEKAGGGGLVLLVVNTMTYLMRFYETRPAMLGIKEIACSCQEKAHSQ
jgi:hypothetical protein